MDLNLLLLIFFAPTILGKSLSDSQPHTHQNDSLIVKSFYNIASNWQYYSNTPTNFVISPISIATVIGELTIGIKGQNRNHLCSFLIQQANRRFSHKASQELLTDCINVIMQMDKIVHELQRDNSYTFESSNALFYAENLILDDNFKNCLEAIYGTEIVRVNFIRDYKKINNWINEKTRKQVFIDLKPSSTFVLANIIYFKAFWDQPFSNHQNLQRIFHTPNGKIKHTFMNRLIESCKYFYSKDLKLTLVAIPYKNYELTMGIILPDTDHKYAYTINRLSSDLDYTILSSIISKSILRRVHVWIPKFNIEYQEDMLKSLSKFMDLSNNKTIEMDSATHSNTVPLSRIVHKTRFSVNENGTEAVSILAPIMDLDLPKDFKVERPFIFYVRHERTGALLYYGAISKPEE